MISFGISLVHVGREEIVYICLRGGLHERHILPKVQIFCGITQFAKGGTCYVAANELSANNYAIQN